MQKVKTSLKENQSPGIHLEDVYYFENLNASPGFFSVGVWNGIVVRVPAVYKTYLNDTIESMSNSFTKRHYEVSRIV